MAQKIIFVLFLTKKTKILKYIRNNNAVETFVQLYVQYNNRSTTISLDKELQAFPLGFDARETTQKDYGWWLQ